jgi:hypothetical protein
MSSSYEPIPLAWVERIFERMTALYGVQKMSAMWTGVNAEQVKQTWAQSLGRYPRQAIAQAVEAMADECGAWPPSLPEFCGLVRGKVAAPEHRPALPVPNRTKAEIAAGAAQMDRIKSLLRGAVKRVPA